MSNSDSWHALAPRAPWQINRAQMLGRGSFAEVFLGRSESGVSVAIKRVSRSLLEQKHNKKVLKSEIRTLRAMKHPNIVQLLAVVDTPQHICLVMEFCDGGDLATFISEYSPTSESTVKHFTREIATALKYLADNNIFHRDLKPQNILLCRQPTDAGDADISKVLPTAKLADFGFARELGLEDLTSTYCGSPLYMAPEVMERGRYNRLADMWSLGVLLYHLYVGRPPFTAPNLRALRKAIRHSRVTLPPTSSPELSDLILRLIRVDHHQRIELSAVMKHPFVERRAHRPSETGREDTVIMNRRAKPGDGGGDALALRKATMETQGLVNEPSFVVVDRITMEQNMFLDDLHATDGLRSVIPHQRLSCSQEQSFLHWVRGLSEPGCAVMRLAAQRRSSVVSDLSSLSDSSITASQPLVGSGSTSSLAQRKPQKSTAHLRVEDLLLYLKALSLFQENICELRRVVESRGGLPCTTDAAEAVQHLSVKFNECLRRIESLRSTGSGDGGELPSVVSSAEQQIYQHAMHLLREAAADEVLDNLQASELNYRTAIILLGIIIRDSDGRSGAILRRYALAARQRLDGVEAKMQSAARALVEPKDPQTPPVPVMVPPPSPGALSPPPGGAGSSALLEFCFGDSDTT